MTVREKQYSFLLKVSSFLTVVESEYPRIVLTGGELWRSNIEQNRLFNEGLTKVRRSDHQNRLAIDFNIFIEGAWITTAPLMGDDNFSPILLMGMEWESIVAESSDLVSDWGGRYGVKARDYNSKIGWDFGHFGVK